MIEPMTRIINMNSEEKTEIENTVKMYLKYETILKDNGIEVQDFYDDEKLETIRRVLGKSMIPSIPARIKGSTPRVLISAILYAFIDIYRND